MPEPWNPADLHEFVEHAKKVADSLRYKESGIRPVAEWSTGEKQPELKLLSLFAVTAAGVFNPLCAFQGGVVAQEVVKAITSKFTPIGQVFYYDAYEVLPVETFEPLKHTGEELVKFANETLHVQE
jgi:hypothetical protein